jgi:hypothetical protein
MVSNDEANNTYAIIMEDGISPLIMFQETVWEKMGCMPLEVIRE